MCIVLLFLPFVFARYKRRLQEQLDAEDDDGLMTAKVSSSSTAEFFWAAKQVFIWQDCRIALIVEESAGMIILQGAGEHSTISVL